MDRAAQFVPSQCSATATPWVPSALPTAVHEVAELHETPSNATSNCPEGAGTVWSVQLVPFQRTASGWLGKSLNPAPPTAVQALAEVQDTPRR